MNIPLILCILIYICGMVLFISTLIEGCRKDDIVFQRKIFVSILWLGLIWPISAFIYAYVVNRDEQEVE